MKFFVVVCAALFAFACATDPTEDLGVNGVSQTEITLSLEDTKTHINAPVGDEYPLYWSEGDQISVNGVPSNPLSKEQAGRAAATFTVSGDHTTYHIAYPAAPANQVLFAANQKHVGNTSFGSNVSTLYGVGSKEEGAKLHHLTGVLKFGVTGSATLSHAQISTIDRTPIAGAFDIDFATGNVTPSKEAVSTINYSFGEEGVQLSSTATMLHIAVPAGVYTELYVTLYDKAGGVKHATVKANDERPLEAGIIRIFSNIAYAPTSTLHVVKDVASLKALPSVTTDAVVVCDIDLSNEDWTPLEGYAHTLNGNGYAIKGLKAPLFGTTTASIKGLHLEGVNITSEGKATVGALACHYKGNLLTNCSASGTLTVDLNGVTEYVCVGGMVGLAGQIDSEGKNVVKADTIANLTNNINVEVDGDISGNTAGGVNVGGCVGRANITTATNLLNNGTITIASTFKTGVTANYFAGTLGYLSPGAGAVISNIANTGAVTVGGTYAKKVQVGGCSGHHGFGDNNTVLNYVRNSGAVTISENTTVSGELIVGGIAGVCAIKNTDNATTINTGTIEIKSGVSATAETFYVGGCIGWTDKVITHLSNSAPITIHGSYGATRIGGVFGMTKTTTNNLLNSGKITFDGMSSAETLIGGCVGFESTKRTLTYLTNSGTIEFKGVDITGLAVAGGCLGSFNNDYGGTLQESSNEGAIYVDNKSKFGGQFIVAGCLGRLNKENSGNMINLTNNAPITIYAKEISSHLYVGGIGAYIQASNEHSGLLNDAKGDIKINVTASKGNLQVGGVVAQVQDSTTDLCNKGDIEIEGGTISKDTVVGGIIGNPNNYIRTDLVNSGNISINATFKGYLYVGGVEAGSGNYSKIHFANSGNINIKSNTTVGGAVRVGGICGYLTGAAVKLLSNDKGEGCYNTGNVTFSGTAGSGDADDVLYMGGAFGYITDKTTGLLGDVSNSGSVIFNGTHTGSAMAAIGGVFGCNLGNISTMTSLVFSGEKLECTGSSPDETTYIGGIVAHTVSPVTGAKAFCNILAYNDPDNRGYSNVGMVMGTPPYDSEGNTTRKATNCHIGGAVCTSKDGPGNPNWTDLDDYTYVEYIYGKYIVPEEEAITDKLGWLDKSINDIPIDASGLPIVNVEPEEV